MKLTITLLICTVCGFTALATPQWTKGTYTNETYVAIANRLNGDSSQALYDSDPATFKQWVNSYNSFTYEYEQPVDLTGVAFYSVWDTGRVGFVISNLMVRCEGSADFVEIPDTYVDHYGTSGRPPYKCLCAVLSDDDFLATNVVALKIQFGPVQNGYIGGAELEVGGTPYVAETLTSDAFIAAGALNAKLSALAHDYPISVHLCSGSTNGGDDPAAWDKDVVVGKLDSAEDLLDYQGAVDYAYGRFYFTSAAYKRTIWSSTVEVSSKPYAELIRAEATSLRATFEATLVSPGLDDSCADIRFAYAVKGTALPTPTTIHTAVAPGATVTHRLAGLEPMTEYDYTFVIANASGETQTITGSFNTLSPGSWITTPDITIEDFEWPVHHLSGGNGGYSFDGILDSIQSLADTYSRATKITYTFSKPQDLKSITLYMLFGGRAQVAYGNGIKVKYAGADDYTTIPMSVKPAPEDTNWRTYRYRFAANDEFFATNVVALVLEPTFEQNGYAVANEVVLEGWPSDHDQVRWEYGDYPEDEYQPDPAALDSLVASRTNFDAREYDGDLYSSYYMPNSGAANPYKDGTGRRNGHTYTWEFRSAVDLSGVEICTYGPKSYGGRNEIAVEGLYIRQRGSDEFVRVPGSSFDRFSCVSSNHYARLVSETSDKYPLKNVKAAKLVLGTFMYGHVGSYISEVHPLGRQSKGLLIILR